MRKQIAIIGFIGINAHCITGEISSRQLDKNILKDSDIYEPDIYAFEESNKKGKGQKRVNKPNWMRS